MSYNEDTKNIIIIRKKAEVNQKLKEQVGERNRESLTIFQRRAKTSRSPPRTIQKNAKINPINKETTEKAQ